MRGLRFEKWIAFLSVFFLVLVCGKFYGSVLGITIPLKREPAKARAASTARAVPTAEETRLGQQAAKSVNAFAFELFNSLTADDKENIFFSPQSVSSVFGMVCAGAEGETKKEIETVFHFGQDTHQSLGALQKILNDTPKSSVAIEAANAVWPDKKLALERSYVDAMVKYYGSKITQLDFQKPDKAVRAINKWTYDKTRGLIKKAVAAEQIDPATRLILTSAIYFKGQWADIFPEKNTKPEPFFRADGTETKAYLMNRQGVMGYFATDDLQAVRMPYIGNSHSMLVVLPVRRDDPCDSLLTAETFDELLKSNYKTEVNVFLPKFKIETEYNLIPALKKAGIESAFSEAAQFQGISRTSLYINGVIHKTFVDNNEEGTEAAAVTATVIAVTAVLPDPPPPPVFRADHPFMYFILDDLTGAILFMGRYGGP